MWSDQALSEIGRIANALCVGPRILLVSTVDVVLLTVTWCRKRDRGGGGGEEEEVSDCGGGGVEGVSDCLGLNEVLTHNDGLTPWCA